MKRFLTIVGCTIFLCGCRVDSGSTWDQDMIVGDVPCCLTAQQVQGSIYSALLKLRWYIRDKYNNGFVATINCSGQDIDIFIENTDKEYFISPSRTANVAGHEYCLEYNMDRLDQVIYKYLVKITKKEAKRELKRMRQEY